MEVIMNQHPYLRAYMAGIAAPTALLLVALAIFCVARFVFRVPVPIERAIVVPLMIVPNAFGLWNMLYLKLRPHWKTPIGLHGALLPFFLGPIGFVVATGLGFVRAGEHGLIAFDVIQVPYWRLVVAPFFAIAVYYLLWKYLVGFLNRVVEIAE
jgi:hypothetical protein